MSPQQTFTKILKIVPYIFNLILSAINKPNIVLADAQKKGSEANRIQLA